MEASGVIGEPLGSIWAQFRGLEGSSGSLLRAFGLTLEAWGGHLGAFGEPLGSLWRSLEDPLGDLGLRGRKNLFSLTLWDHFLEAFRDAVDEVNS